MKVYASISAAIVFSVCMFTQLAHAQIFSWVDEQGVKNFGDKVPEKYKKDESEVSLNKLNTAQSVDTAKLNELSENIKASNDKREESKPKLEEVATEQAKPQTCEEQIEEYERSYACFDKCRNANGSINRAKCPDCVSVTRPACYESDSIILNY